ncbi:hypothetical protein OMR07_28160, partial [Methylobacterium organophilum]|nr:hypothetical protein [Methylobacterium organophilum]
MIIAAIAKVTASRRSAGRRAASLEPAGSQGRGAAAGSTAARHRAGGHDLRAQRLVRAQQHLREQGQAVHA